MNHSVRRVIRLAGNVRGAANVKKFDMAAPPAGDEPTTDRSGVDPSPDHFAGTQQHRLRNRDSERLGGFQIDHVLELRGLLHRTRATHTLPVAGWSASGLAVSRSAA